MKGELYRRWLIEGRDLTLDEFVAERRAEVRSHRAQRRLWKVMGPQMQQAPQTALWQQFAMLQNDPRALYRGHSLGGALSSLLGGLFR